MPPVHDCTGGIWVKKWGKYGKMHNIFLAILSVLPYNRNDLHL